MHPAWKAFLECKIHFWRNRMDLLSAKVTGCNIPVSSRSRRLTDLLMVCFVPGSIASSVIIVIRFSGFDRPSSVRPFLPIPIEMRFGVPFDPAAWAGHFLGSREELHKKCLRQTSSFEVMFKNNFCSVSFRGFLSLLNFLFDLDPELPKG